MRQGNWELHKGISGYKEEEEKNQASMLAPSHYILPSAMLWGSKKVYRCREDNIGKLFTNHLLLDILLSMEKGLILY